MANRILRPIRIEGNMAYVPLTKGREAVVDAADIPLIKDQNWCLLSVGYAVTNLERVAGKKRMLLMHRFILNAPSNMQVDHIDGDRLNNRRANLRLATKSENMRNRGPQADNKSGFKGVCWIVRDQRWMAQIKHNRKQIYLGYFETAEEAHAAYAAACIKYHGDFARLS